MALPKPLKIYERSANGFRGNKAFKELSLEQPEGVFTMRNNLGFNILIPAHFFESAYRRVRVPYTDKNLTSKYFSQGEIDRLKSFCSVGELLRNERYVRRGLSVASYGYGTIQLILDVADAATYQRPAMLNKLKWMSSDKKQKIQKRLVDIAIAHNNPVVMSMTQEEAIRRQKLKFSSRINRYPFVFSLVENDPNQVLLNTVYLKGDSYPKHTIRVFRP